MINYTLIIAVIGFMVISVSVVLMAYFSSRRKSFRQQKEESHNGQR